MEKITKEEVLYNLELNWKPFKTYMIEKLYGIESVTFFIKTRWNTVYKCTVQWKQGRGNNYYFGSEFNEDGYKIFPDDVVQYQIQQISDD